jgi:hypothetical protein
MENIETTTAIISGEEEKIGTEESSPSLRQESPTSSDKRKGNGKLGYTEEVEKIDRQYRVVLKKLDKIDKIEALLSRISTPSVQGDLTTYVERGLSGQESERNGTVGRDEIARTWEEGKRTVEELDAFYSRLRTQKIWSQEDLEEILTRLEAVAQRIADSIHAQQTATELESSPTDKDPDQRTLEAIKNLFSGISELGEKIAESRRTILAAIADRASVPMSDREISFDPNVLSPLLQKIGDLEGVIREHRPSASLDPASAVGSAGLPARGIRASLFAKTISEVPKSAEKSVMSPRIKRLGFIWIMVSLTIVAIVAQVRHSGPPLEQTKPIANRESLRTLPTLPKVESRLPESVPTFQSLAPILAALDRIRGGENANGQALSDLSEKIDRALASVPKETVLTAKEKRLIGEGRELEWLVKTWPAGPGRQELLRMMGSYAGE